MVSWKSLIRKILSRWWKTLVLNDSDRQVLEEKSCKDHLKTVQKRLLSPPWREKNSNGDQTTKGKKAKRWEKQDPHGATRESLRERAPWNEAQTENRTIETSKGKDKELTTAKEADKEVRVDNLEVLQKVQG